MIELYTWATPNGRKISIALEEMGLPYRVHPVNIAEGEQRSPEFTAISPNQKIPAIVDTETGLSLMESGAILMYLASRRLEDRPFIVGDDYTIADIATWPWVARHEYQTVDLDEYPNVLAWYLRIARRPAVKAGWNVPVRDEIPLPEGVAE